VCCVLKLNLYACNLERGTRLGDLVDRSPHLNVNTTRGTRTQCFRTGFEKEASTWCRCQML
jgi:hypothetical protein